VRRSLPHIKAYRHQHALILSGDHLYSMDYRRVLEHHQNTDADVTIGTIPVTAEQASAFGILKTDDEHVITEFHEKPAPNNLGGKESPVSPELEEQGRIYMASMGIYVFDREPLRGLLQENPTDNDFGKQIIPKAIEGAKVVSYPFTGYWRDVGTIQSFYEANLMLGEPQPPFSLYDATRPLYTRARMLPPAKIQNASIQDALIAEGSLVVDSQVSQCVVGIRSYVGPGTTLKNTVMMGADQFRWAEEEEQGFSEGPANPGIGANSYIEGAIIDKNVSIGEGCVIKNREGVQEAEEDRYYIRDGIVVIPKNTVIPDGTEI